MFSTKNSLLEIFEGIDKNDHHQRVMYFEENADLILSLEVGQRYFLNYQYLISLFEIGNYQVLLDQVDPIIEYVFLDNVTFSESSTYEHLLFLKAKSLFQLMRYEGAIDIVSQLVGISPSSQDYAAFHTRALRAKLNFKSSGVKLVAAILILFSAIGSGYYWMQSSQGQESSRGWMMALIWGPCALAIAILALSFLLNHKKSEARTKALIIRARSKPRLTEAA